MGGGDVQKEVVGETEKGVGEGKGQVGERSGRVRSIGKRGKVRKERGT